MSNHNALPKLPSLPRLVSVVPCGCGCGRTCQNRFAPGHDAKLLGYVKRVNAGVWDTHNRESVVHQLTAMAAWHEGCAKATAKALGMSWQEVLDEFNAIEDLKTGTEG